MKEAGRFPNVLALAAVAAMARSAPALSEWSGAFDAIPEREPRIGPRYGYEPERPRVLRHVAISKAKKKRAAKQARRQRRLK